jgi:hypothetical protein
VDIELIGSGIGSLRITALLALYFFCDHHWDIWNFHASALLLSFLLRWRTFTARMTCLDFNGLRFLHSLHAEELMINIAFKEISQKKLSVISSAFASFFRDSPFLLSALHSW